MIDLIGGIPPTPTRRASAAMARGHQALTRSPKTNRLARQAETAFAHFGCGFRSSTWPGWMIAMPRWTAGRALIVSNQPLTFG